jgi:hypothetical protein
LSTAEYFIPNLASRLKAGAFIGAVVLWGTSHQLWLNPLIASIDSCSLCASLWQTRVLAIYLVAIPFVLSVSLGYLAQRIIKSGQNPPPQSWLFFKVRLYRGFRARVAGYTLAIAGFSVALVPGLLAYHFGFAYIFCIAEDCGCTQTTSSASVPQACTVKANRDEA